MPPTVTTPSKTPYRRAIERALGRSQEVPRVAVVSDRPTSVIAGWVRECRPDAHIDEFTPSGVDDGELAWRRTLEGAYDVVLDETHKTARFGRVPELLFALRTRGRLLLRQPGKNSPAEKATPQSLADRRRFGELIGAAAGASTLLGHRTEEWPAEDEERFGRAVSSIQLHDGVVELVCGVDALVKVREEGANELLAARPEIGRVVETLPAQAFVSRGRVVTSPSERAGAICEEWQVPELSLREYADVLTVPGQVALRGDLVLPDTFRHNQFERVKNRYLRDLGVRYAIEAPSAFPVPEAAPSAGFTRDESGTARLEGAYFYLDDEYRGHFGHLTTEVISRLWAWERARREAPGLKALMHTNRRADLLDYEIEIFAAAGIAKDDIVFSHEPVCVERLFAATPMLSNPAYVHPEIVRIWDGIGDRLVAPEAGIDRGRRIFLSRRIKKRACRNTDEVESFFAGHGFAVIFPEDYPLGEQIRIFREADVIAGFAGSGMFNLMFVPEPKDVIVVASESYYAQNEYQIAGARGHRVVVAWCASEAPWTEGVGFPMTDEAMQTPYEFDLDHAGAFVEEALRRIAG